MEQEVKYLIEVRSNFTQCAYYVDTIDGKELYSLSPNDAKQYSDIADANIKAVMLDTEKIKHQVIEHIF